MASVVSTNGALLDHIWSLLPIDLSIIHVGPIQYSVDEVVSQNKATTNSHRCCLLVINWGHTLALGTRTCPEALSLGKDLEKTNSRVYPGLVFISVPLIPKIYTMLFNKS